MTQPGSPVTTVPGFQLDPSGGPGPEVVQLYELQTAAPERIESVYLTLDYLDSKPEFQLYAIQLRDPAGNVVAEQPTPVLNAADNANLIVVLNWSRLGNDSAQEGFFIYDDTTSGYARAYANMRLPDLVLSPQSTVQFLFWGNVETMAGTIPVSDASVTTTRNAGAVSSTDTVQGIPLLTDISTA